MNFLTPVRFHLLLAAALIAQAAVSMARAKQWDHFLIGDCPYYGWTCETLVRDFDWDMSNQLPGDLSDHNHFFAISADNRIVAKHSTLLPILSIPFFVVFGKIGFLLVNLLLLFMLILGIVQLAGGGLGARWLGLATYASTPLLSYTFNYSPDVLGATLLTWAYLMAIRRHVILCGFLAGLTIWAKSYLALLLLPLALILIPQGKWAVIRCALAAVVTVAPMLIINAHLFGSPFISGYDRETEVNPEGGFIIKGHYSRFNQPLLTGLGNLLFHQEIGMLKTAPLWFVWPIALAYWMRSGDRCHKLRAVAFALAIVLNLLLFAKYDEWDATVYGNRFLFPALALGFALQGPLWEYFARRIRQGRGQDWT